MQVISQLPLRRQHLHSAAHLRLGAQLLHNNSRAVITPARTTKSIIGTSLLHQTEPLPPVNSDLGRKFALMSYL